MKELMQELLEMMANNKSHDELEAAVFEHLYQLHLKYGVSPGEKESGEKLKLQMEELIKGNGDKNISNNFNSFDFSWLFYVAYKRFYLCFQKRPKISKAEFENRLRHLCVDLTKLEFFDRMSTKVKSEKYFAKRIFHDNIEIFGKLYMQFVRGAVFNPDEVTEIEKLFIEKCQKTINSNQRLLKKTIFKDIFEEFKLLPKIKAPKGHSFKVIGSSGAVERVLEQSKSNQVVSLYQEFTHNKFRKK